MGIRVAEPMIAGTVERPVEETANEITMEEALMPEKVAIAEEAASEFTREEALIPGQVAIADKSKEVAMIAGNEVLDVAAKNGSKTFMPEEVAIAAKTPVEEKIAEGEEPTNEGKDLGNEVKKKEPVVIDSLQMRDELYIQAQEEL